MQQTRKCSYFSVKKYSQNLMDWFSFDAKSGIQLLRPFCSPSLSVPNVASGLNAESGIVMPILINDLGLQYYRTKDVTLTRKWSVAETTLDLDNGESDLTR